MSSKSQAIHLWLVKLNLSIPFFSGSEVSDCGRYLITTPSENTRNNQLYFSDLNKLENGITGKIDLTPVVTDFEADFHVRRKQDL